MSLAEPPSYESVPNVMTAKRLIESLSTWLEDENPLAPRCDPKRLYRVAQQTIDELGAEASHESLLKQAKKNWHDIGPPSESETLGVLFRAWMSQHRQDPGDHHRAMATLFAEVQRVLPDAAQKEKLQALKGLWTACYQGSPTP